MKGRRDNYRVNGMMILTVVIVFAVLAAVILGFEMLQKRQEKKISSAKNIPQNETTMEIQNETMEASEASLIEADLTEEKETDSEITVCPQDGGYQIEDSIVESEAASVEEVEIVYLIKGDNKGSNKYARVDRLSYTDSVKYTEAQLDCLDTYGLRIIRNEIYARHGRMFNDQELQEYFTGQDWYIPQSSSGAFDESCLNDIEKYNAALIQAYELKQWD